jgi:uncharacterized protein
MHLCNIRFLSGLCLTMLIVMLLVWGTRQWAIFRLWDAIEQADLAYVEYYAEKGRDLNIRPLVSGEAPLFYALRQRKRDSYRALLELGADPNASSRGGQTVIHFAASEPDSYWLSLALEFGGDPNLFNQRWGSFPLAFAIEFEGRLDNVKLLCESGADIDVPDRYGRTPLTLASDAAEFEILYYLLEQGADYRKVTRPGFTFFDSFRQKTPEVYERSSPENAKWCRAAREWLKERGADPDRARWDGRKWVFEAGDAENDGT